MKTLTLIIKVFLVGLSQFRGLFWFGFVLVGNHSVRMAKNVISIQSQSSPPRQRELRLGEGVLA